MKYYIKRPVLGIPDNIYKDKEGDEYKKSLNYLFEFANYMGLMGKKVSDLDLIVNHDWYRLDGVLKPHTWICKVECTKEEYESALKNDEEA